MYTHMQIRNTCILVFDGGIVLLTFSYMHMYIYLYNRHMYICMYIRLCVSICICLLGSTLNPTFYVLVASAVGTQP